MPLRWRERGASGTSLFAITLLVIAFGASRLLILEHYQPKGTDVTIYHAWYEKAVRGETPYADFSIEYPPVAWWVMKAPGDDDWPTYWQRFRRVMFAADVAAFLVFLALVFDRHRPAAVLLGAAYIAATSALAPVLFDRLDGGVLLCLLVSACAWSRGSAARPGRLPWIATAYAVLGLGTAFKLVPILAAPALFLSELTTRQPARAIAARACALCAGVFLPFVAQYLAGGTKLFAFLEYHGARGLELESVPANLIWLASLVGLPTSIVFRFTSFEFESPVASAVARLSSVVMVGLLVVLVWRAVRLGRAYTRDRAYSFGFLSLPLALVATKVLSPQYFLFVGPILLLLGAETLTGRRALVAYAGLVVTLSLLTTAVYPFGFGGLRVLRLDVWSILTARNVLFAALVGWLFTRLTARRPVRRPGGEAPEGPDETPTVPTDQSPPATTALVVIPTYNERENLERLARSVLSSPRYRLLVVDDASPDGTGAVADGLAAAFPGRAEVIHRNGPRGFGLACRDAFRRALESDATVICQMDADFSHDPRYLDRLVEAISTHDVAIGSRYVPGAGVVNWPLWRRFLSAGANRYVRLVTGLRPHDCTSGFRCWRRQALARVPVDRISSEGYAFLVETLFEAARRGARVTEVPIVFVERQAGHSKLSVGVMLEAIMMPWRLRLRRRRAGG